jgi:hypothetical protein
MKNTDKYELYSFSIYLYLYGFFYLFIFEQTFVKGLLINILVNIFSFFMFKYNFITFLKHKYWRENLTDIAMPQLINCATNITVYSTLHIRYYNILVLSLCDVLTYFLIKNMYKNEISYSKNLRFIINIIFLLVMLL